MPYVTRDEKGFIVTISDHQTALESEQLPYGHPEVQEFLLQHRPDDVHGALAQSDAAMSRIIEDLIDVLVKKNIINFTDLPLPAQKKLVSRQNLRRDLSALTNLVSDQDDIL
ncbi:hypothetical protein [Curvivirga aplysinae]|uniref:hypothetical protein n=1 Tax=Curvivirga aplysinae TaxID=2529852 RepID=UPI0012BC1B21|nr:hypothetical protein [Curvivirga aplysinae]MTI10242.1 hypothetical protein [Curvivirga aplysinae]